MADNTGIGHRSAGKFGAMSSPTNLDLDRLQQAGIGAFFRPSQLEVLGITSDQLKALVKKGVVEHVARGLYRHTGAEVTEHYSLAAVSARVPDSVICLLSALRVHEIGAQISPEVWLAIPHKAEPPRLASIKLRLIRFSGSAWSSGIEKTTFEGVPAKITSPARTVLDCFRFERLVGREAALEALHDSLRQRKVEVDELYKLMNHLPSKLLRAALETMAP